MIRGHYWIFAFGLSFAEPSSVLAAATQAMNPDAVQEITIEVDTPAHLIESPGFIDNSHDLLSQQVERYVRGVDAFFSDDRVYEESTGSYIRISGATTFSEEGDMSFSGTIRAKARFPHTKKKLQLLIESDDQEDSKDNPVDVVRDSDYSAAVRNVFKDTVLWNVHADAGIKVRTPLDPFVRFRVRRSFSPENWAVRLSETLFWFNSDGLGETTQLNLDRRIADKSLFRARSTATWLYDVDQFNLSQDFFVFHEIDEKAGLIYHLAAFADTKPVIHTTAYLAAVGYRRKIYKEWLFIEFKPQIEYFKESDFESIPSVILKLEAIIGDGYR